MDMYRKISVSFLTKFENVVFSVRDDKNTFALGGEKDT